MRQTIGILGGIGPESTANVYMKIVNKVQKKGLIKSNTDYPRIIIDSIPAPELFVGEPDLSLYVEGLKNLEKAGVDFIIIACNTAYLHYDKLQQTINIPILDLRKEVKKYLADNEIKSLVVLGTNKTIRSDLFENTIKLNEQENKELDQAIFNFNTGKSKEKQIEKVVEIAREYSDKFLLTACTETALMLKDSGISFVDTMDILVDAALEQI